MLGRGITPGPYGGYHLPLIGLNCGRQTKQSRGKVRSFIERVLPSKEIVRKIGTSVRVNTVSTKASAPSIVKHGPIYALSNPNQSLLKKTDANDSVFAPADSKELLTEDIIWYPERWNQGEGGIDWKGTSSLSGRTNFFRITWQTSQIVGFVAEATNLNNDKDANVGYFFRVYASPGSPLLREGFLVVARVANEDWYSPPATVYDREVGSTVNVSFGHIEVQRTVGWVRS